MNRIKSIQVALATTFTFLLLYIVCAAAVALVPDATVNFFDAWFHGLDLNLLKAAGGKPLTWAQFVTGFSGVIVVALPGGFVLIAISDLRQRWRTVPESRLVQGLTFPSWEAS